VLKDVIKFFGLVVLGFAVVLLIVAVM